MKNSIKILIGAIVITGSTLLIEYKSNASSGYDGTCCQRKSGSCEHPNGMVFEKATWIQGASTCTGHEDPSIGF